MLLLLLSLLCATLKWHKILECKKQNLPKVPAWPANHHVLGLYFCILPIIVIMWNRNFFFFILYLHIPKSLYEKQNNRKKAPFCSVPELPMECEYGSPNNTAAAAAASQHCRKFPLLFPQLTVRSLVRSYVCTMFGHKVFGSKSALPFSLYSNHQIMNIFMEYE